MTKKKLKIRSENSSWLAPGLLLLTLAAYSYYSTKLMTERIEVLETIVKKNSTTGWGEQSSTSHSAPPTIQVVNNNTDTLTNFKSVTRINPKDLKLEFNVPFCSLDQDQVQIIIFKTRGIKFYDTNLPENSKQLNWNPELYSAEGSYKRDGMILYLDLKFKDGNSMYIPAKVLAYNSIEKVINSITILEEVYSRRSCHSVGLQ